MRYGMDTAVSTLDTDCRCLSGGGPVENEERTVQIALAACPGLEPSTLRKLVRGLGTATAVWQGDGASWVSVCRIQPQTIERIEQWRRRWPDPTQCVASLQHRDIQCITQGDELYPARLLDLAQPPLVLFLKGPSLGREQPFPFDQMVSVVGTRRASGYALEAARWMGEVFAQVGAHVVSGLAYGVDYAVHAAVAAEGGTTSCVLACGVDLCYPVNHKPLYNRICERGFAISEFAPGTVVDKHRFPERNRIIAALSPSLIVVQAGEKSGALVTVEQALAIGRDVYAVPGPITSAHFRGSNRLLYQGAQVFLDPRDFIIERGGFLQPQLLTRQQPAERWNALYDLLDVPSDAAALAEQLDVPMSHVFAGLLELELDGWIERVPGGLYGRKATH